MKKNITLSILSGLLLWLAWPPTPYTTFLLFIGFVPMLVAMENIIRADVQKKGKKLFWVTFAGFFVWNTLCIYWVYNALKDFTGPLIAIPVTLIPYALGPLLMATACWFYYRLRLKSSRALGLAGLVCLWLGYEYLHQNWALNFPWMTLGNGFAVSHQWVQWYEYTGVYGGTVWVWLVNIFIFLTYIGLRESQTKALRLKLISAAVLTFILPLAFSLYRYNTYQEQSDPSNVVVVQPDIDPYAKFTSPPMEQLNILTRLSDSLAQANTEFFIWPETAISEQTEEGHIRANRYYLQARQFINKYKNGNVISGIESCKIYPNRATETASPLIGSNDEYYDSFNAAIAIENSADVQFYHKSKLVPGAETIPFGSALSFIKPVFEKLGGSAGSYGYDSEPKVFYSQSGIGVDPVICYESIYGEYVARAVHKGAQFIAIMTNDGWWGNTSGKDQHLEYAKLRAIECRRWVCRSANTGVSAFINQRGDIVRQTTWWTRTALKQDINLNSDLTFYVRYGDYMPKTGSLLAGLIILSVLIRLRLRKKSIEAK